jgi:hypothetical protein
MQQKIIFKDVYPNPVNPNWIIGSSWRNCKLLQQKDCVIYKELHLSQDGGKSWKLVTKYLVHMGWAMKTKKNDQVPPKRIIWSEELGCNLIVNISR